MVREDEEKGESNDERSGRGIVREAEESCGSGQSRLVTVMFAGVKASAVCCVPACVRECKYSRSFRRMRLVASVAVAPYSDRYSAR